MPLAHGTRPAQTILVPTGQARERLQPQTTLLSKEGGYGPSLPPHSCPSGSMVSRAEIWLKAGFFTSFWVHFRFHSVSPKPTSRRSDLTTPHKKPHPSHEILGNAIGPKWCYGASHRRINPSATPLFKATGSALQWFNTKIPKAECLPGV